MPIVSTRIIYEGNKRRTDLRAFHTEFMERFTLGIIKALDHRAHREELGDIPVLSVRLLRELCAKFFAVPRPSKKFMNNPG